jgi:hypothetical protein
LPLLLFEIALRLELGLLLRKKRLLLLGLEYALLFLVFPVLAVDLALPELVDLVWLVGLRCWRRSGLLLDLLFGARGKCWRVLIFCEQVGRILRQLWYGDETREVAEVGAFVVEFDEAVVLSVVPLTERFQGVVVPGG